MIYKRQEFTSVESLAQYAYSMLKGKYIALSGGSTYKKILSLWPCENLLDKVFLCADERIVGLEDPESNLQMINQVFLKRCNLSSQLRFHYENLSRARQVLYELFGENVVFDQIFLGMGEDGHCASLFPNCKESKNMSEDIIQTKAPCHPYERLSLSLKAIKNANECIVICYGEKKLEVLDKVLMNPKDYPLGLALENSKKVTLLTSSIG